MPVVARTPAMASGTPIPLEHNGRLAGCTVSQIAASGPRSATGAGAIAVTGPATGAPLANVALGAAGVSPVAGTNGVKSPNGLPTTRSADDASTPPISTVMNPVPERTSSEMSPTSNTDAALQ